MKLRKTRIAKTFSGLLLCAIALADKGSTAYFKLTGFEKEKNVNFTIPLPFVLAMAGCRVVNAMFVTIGPTYKGLTKYGLNEYSMGQAWWAVKEFVALEHDREEAESLGLEKNQVANYILNQVQLRERSMGSYEGENNLRFRDTALLGNLRRQYLADFYKIPEADLNTKLSEVTGQFTPIPDAKESKVSYSEKPFIQRLNNVINESLPDAKKISLLSSNTESSTQRLSIDAYFYMAQTLADVTQACRKYYAKSDYRQAISSEYFLENLAYEEIIQKATKKYLRHCTDVREIKIFHEHLEKALQQLASDLATQKTKQQVEQYSRRKREAETAYLLKLRELTRVANIVTDSFFEKTKANPFQNYQSIDIDVKADLKACIAAPKLDAASKLVFESLAIVQEHEQETKANMLAFVAEEKRDEVITKAVLLQRHNRQARNKHFVGKAEKVARWIGRSFALVNLSVFAMLAFWGGICTFMAPPFNLVLGPTLVLATALFAGSIAVSVYFAWPKIVAVFSRVGKAIDVDYFRHRQNHSALSAVGLTLGSFLKRTALLVKSPIVWVAVTLSAVRAPLFKYGVVKAASAVMIKLGIAAATATAIASPFAFVFVVMTSIASLALIYRQVKKDGFSFSPKAALEKAKSAYRNKKFASFIVGGFIGVTFVAVSTLITSAGDFFGWDEVLKGASVIACGVAAGISAIGNFLFDFKDTCNGSMKSVSKIGSAFKQVGKRITSVFKKAPEVLAPLPAKVEQVAKPEPSKENSTKYMQQLEKLVPSHKLSLFDNYRSRQGEHPRREFPAEPAKRIMPPSIANS